jgi:KaiC/GvpD/RAD55 family RecA-like ATPase
MIVSIIVRIIYKFIGLYDNLYNHKPIYGDNNHKKIMLNQETIAKIIPPMGKLNKIPTGVGTFDPIIRGGFPSGSVILLIGEAGAGNTEFAYTSASMLSSLISNPVQYDYTKKQLDAFLINNENVKLPDTICYISFSHSKEDIKTELSHSFPFGFPEAFDGKGFIFKDFSSFRPECVTLETDNGWKGMKGIRQEEKQLILKELISTLEFHAQNSLVIIDSLSSLRRACCLEWADFISFLEELQKKSKKWDGMIYLELGSGIFEKNQEEEVMDIVDGVLVFEWAQGAFGRQQTMYMRKSRGVLPNVIKDNMVRFDTMVTNTDGYVVTNVKRISGR